MSLSLVSLTLTAVADTWPPTGWPTSAPAWCMQRGQAVSGRARSRPAAAPGRCWAAPRASCSSLGCTPGTGEGCRTAGLDRGSAQRRWAEAPHGGSAQGCGTQVLHRGAASPCPTSPCPRSTARPQTRAPPRASPAPSRSLQATHTRTAGAACGGGRHALQPLQNSSLLPHRALHLPENEASWPLTDFRKAQREAQARRLDLHGRGAAQRKAQGTALAACWCVQRARTSARYPRVGTAP